MARRAAPNNWDFYLEKALRILRGRKNAASGVTPAKALLGYELPKRGDWQTSIYLQERAAERRSRRQQRADIRNAQDEFNRKNFPENRRHPHRYCVGDRILTREMREGINPFGPKWRGPYTVVRMKSDEVIVIVRDNKEVEVYIDDVRKAPRGNPPSAGDRPDDVEEGDEDSSSDDSSSTEDSSSESSSSTEAEKGVRESSSETAELQVHKEAAQERAANEEDFLEPPEPSAQSNPVAGLDEPAEKSREASPQPSFLIQPLSLPETALTQHHQVQPAEVLPLSWGYPLLANPDSGQTPPPKELPRRVISASDPSLYKNLATPLGTLTTSQNNNQPPWRRSSDRHQFQQRNKPNNSLARARERYACIGDGEGTPGTRPTREPGGQSSSSLRSCERTVMIQSAGRPDGKCTKCVD